VEDIVKYFGEVPVVDAFATEANKRFPVYWDVQKDAYKQHWGNQGGTLWMNPPFSQMQQVVDKLKTDRARAIVIAPAWTNTD